MSAYKAPIDDMQFLLFDVFDAEQTWQSLPATQELSKDLANSVLEEAAKINETAVAPLNRETDEEGVHFNNGEVTTPKGFKEAFRTLAEGGWVGLGGNPEYDGQGMPKMLTLMFEEMNNAASTAFSLYVSLTGGACVSIEAHASEELKQIYLPKMYSGEWTGTMCLTESHAGTDLGMIRTKAVPNDDGSYAISGTKIFITSGEHDLADNIVHLVLAKLPDAPAGSKGISLFIVPKFHVDAQGAMGDRNAVACGSIEHKMGIHASSTCVMNFDGAKGYMVGEPNEGLKCMFTMMNYERLTVGLQGLGMAERAYQNALIYAKDRLQSRSATGKKFPEKAADPIIVHADVRRMLLTQKAFNEAGRAFAVYVGEQLDIAKWGEGDVKKQAQERVALLTPVAKAFLTDVGLECVVAGQQVFGGHGFIREWGQEQFVRDMRIAQIYEGTNGIQAMDLIGRKFAANKGAFLQNQIDEIRSFLVENKTQADIAKYADQVENGLTELESLAAAILNNAANTPDSLGSAAVEFLHVVGYNLYAYMWLKMFAALNGRDDDFSKSKRLTAQFFFQRLYPRTSSLAASAKADASSVMEMSEELF